MKKKCVFVVYNQALTQRVLFILQCLRVKGYTEFPLVYGVGTNGGEPRMGSHTWPEMNSALMIIIEEDMVPLLLKYFEKLDHVNLENGLRAFVWNIDQEY